MPFATAGVEIIRMNTRAPVERLCSRTVAAPVRPRLIPSSAPLRHQRGSPIRSRIRCSAWLRSRLRQGADPHRRHGELASLSSRRRDQIFEGQANSNSSGYYIITSYRFENACERQWLATTNQGEQTMSASATKS